MVVENWLHLEYASYLAGFRGPLLDRLVHIPAGMRYFDGNSLALMPKAVREEALNVVGQEWADGLIRSWNAAGWTPTRASWSSG